MTEEDPPLEDLLQDILETATVMDVVKGQELVYFPDYMGVSACSEMLANKHISSAPVFHGEECIGIVDFSDIVAFLLSRSWENNTFVKNKDPWKGFETIQIKECLGLSSRNPMVFCNIRDSILEAMEKVAELDLRRMLVKDDAGRVVAVLSPSQMLKHTFALLDGRFDRTMGTSIAKLNINTRKVISVNKDDKLIEAMYKMQENKASVVAVVDPETGLLVGNISMSDVRLVFKLKSFKLLMQRCFDVVTFVIHNMEVEVFPFFAVRPDAKLQTVVSKLIATHVHHLYVVDKKGMPEAVLSFGDACRGIMFNMQI